MKFTKLATIIYSAFLQKTIDFNKENSRQENCNFAIEHWLMKSYWKINLN